MAEKQPKEGEEITCRFTSGEVTMYTPDQVSKRVGQSEQEGGAE